MFNQEEEFPKKSNIRESGKTDFIDNIKSLINEQNKQNSYGFKKARCNGPKKDKPDNLNYYGCWISYKHDPWVLVCWANEFENYYICTPFWIELDEKASENFLKSNLRNEFCFCRHPRITEQIIIPILLEETNNPGKIAENALYIAKSVL